MSSFLGRRLGVLLALVLVATLGWSPGVANANTVGDVLYQVTPGVDNVTYARVIRLAHSGAANGRLLATFEYGVNVNAEAKVPVRQSLDDGQTWTTLAQVADGGTGSAHPSHSIYQPVIYELPQQVGAYPAGTLLLTANVIGRDNSTNFQLWRSTDHGVTWSFVSTYQYARNADVGGDDPGIWEPFLSVNGDGKLVAFFADERQRATHSQFVGHIVSNDGGDTWSAKPDGSLNYAPGLVKDVATSITAERPGMPTVAKLPNGSYVLAYEICVSRSGRVACEAYLKKSTDGGATWGTGPADQGTFVQTTDGRYLGSSPFVAWSPGGGPNGQLMMAGMHVRHSDDNAFALEDHEAVFVNTNNGDGAWSWFPAPLQIQSGGAGSLSNYSPSLLPSVDGRDVRYTAPSYVSGQPKSERTKSANAGVLPYTAPWSANEQKGWKHYGGSWQLSSGVLSETSGANGSKSIAGSTGWGNYVIEADVRRDSAGPASNAGLLFRVSDPAIGADALRGYFFGIGDGATQLGRMNHNWTPLTSGTIAGGSPVGTWVHLRVEVRGCIITATAKRVDDPNPSPPTKGYIDTNCPTAGAVGLRTFDGKASWRNLTVTPL
ncbi:family 16 glycoside hydrolase [Tenggerimyces flavus]|uniref:Family 16 glycoside hydrolase n=1 Tax=Tenggerimyces flavus TaxID=1708749 RepID=A0ABV7YIC3_9ACTN|nr:family 16 glycoside hydrolase [Tenggerimyces flavus]MBM7784705.1 hypothetical protein [Tenggerimyces flavus]